jgi:hypothetical protein
MFLSLTNTAGEKIKQILPTLPHRTPCALGGSVEKNIDSLVQGMILFDQGGGRRGGGKRSWSKALPLSVRGPLVSACSRLFFVVVCARDCEGFFLIFSRAQKYWRETHLLDPLSEGVWQERFSLV